MIRWQEALEPDDGRLFVGQQSELATFAEWTTPPSDSNHSSRCKTRWRHAHPELNDAALRALANYWADHMK